MPSPKRNRKPTPAMPQGDDPDLTLPQNCRIELLADMRRVATDCRRGFGAAADPVGEIFTALLNVCPDATTNELCYVLTAAECELKAEVVRLGGWKPPRVLTAEKPGVLTVEKPGDLTIGTDVWVELAEGRLFDLDWTRRNLDVPRSEWTVKQRRRSGSRLRQPPLADLLGAPTWPPTDGRAMPQGDDPDLTLPPKCRIELLADMRRVATDCRRGFGAAFDVVGEILAALLEVCPDATANEMKYAFTAAERELNAEVARLDRWRMGPGDLTIEKDVWVELAKGRLFDLNWGRGSIDDIPRSEWKPKRPT